MNRTGRLMTSAAVASGVTTMIALLAVSSAQAQFTYLPSGDLPSGSGSGRFDEHVYAPGMLFPIRDAPAYANSQVYGHGGGSGPGGSQCDDENFSYPWRDNYCESRSWDMPLCPTGTGHQGQDIRASDCMRGVHPAIAVVDGRITNIGSYSVYLTADDGTRYDYLHMSAVAVSVGDTVSRGDMMGMVANEFGGTATTVHLHFNIRQTVSGVGTVYVPPYMSLVRAYETLVGGSSPTPPPPPPPPSSGPRLRAEYVAQTFPLSEATFELAGGAEQYGYIELRNTGSEAWHPGQTFLATTEPRDGASPIAGPDWISPSRAATIDRDVAPGATGRFAFTVRAPTTPGDYPQFFGPFHEGVGWFGDDGGPPDRWIEVRVTATPALPVDSDADRDGSPAASDCDDSNASIHPGARDVCGDSIDQDCNGTDATCETLPPPAPPLPDASVAPPATPPPAAPPPPPSGTTRPVEDSDGCSCHVASRQDAPPLLGLGLLGLAFCALRRRRS